MIINAKVQSEELIEIKKILNELSESDSGAKDFDDVHGKIIFLVQEINDQIKAILSKADSKTESLEKKGKEIEKDVSMQLDSLKYMLVSLLSTSEKHYLKSQLDNENQRVHFLDVYEILDPQDKKQEYLQERNKSIQKIKQFSDDYYEKIKSQSIDEVSRAKKLKSLIESEKEVFTRTRLEAEYENLLKLHPDLENRIISSDADLFAWMIKISEDQLIKKIYQEKLALHIEKHPFLKSKT